MHHPGFWCDSVQNKNFEKLTEEEDKGAEVHCWPEGKKIPISLFSEKYFLILQEKHVGTIKASYLVGVHPGHVAKLSQG